MRQATGRAELHNDARTIASHLRWEMFRSTRKEHKSRDGVNVKVIRTLRARFSFKRQTYCCFSDDHLVKQLRNEREKQPRLNLTQYECAKTTLAKKIFLDEIDNVQGRSGIFDDFSGRNQYKQDTTTWKQILSR